MQQFYASAVEIEGRAVLILGDSGAGKSALARELMAMGANLVGDDQVFLEEVGGSLYVRPHSNARGRLEIRGVGIFKANEIERAELIMAVNLNMEPEERLPRSKYFQHGLTKIAQYDIMGVSHMASFIYLLLTQRIEIEYYDE